jgi:hypothetical protein
MRFVFQITHEGDGTTFNRGAPDISPWAGQWADFYLKQQHPRSWRVRRFLNNVTNNRGLGKP